MITPPRPAYFEEVAPGDTLRGWEEALRPDPRNESSVVFDESGIRKSTLADQYECIRGFELNPAVPHSIKVHFETARNLYLYSWFVYRFYPVAEQQALTSLEFALRKRLPPLEDTAKGKPQFEGLALRLRRARELGLITNEGLKIRERLAMRSARARYDLEALEEMIRTGVTEMVLDDSNIEPNEQDFNGDWIGRFVESLPKIRNEYAHGSHMLHPTVLGRFEIVCDLINQLYPNEG